MEIKRYGIVFDQYPSEDGSRMVRTPPYIAPRSDGMYMLYADHMEIMESIGGGGVTGNIDALDAIIAQCEKKIQQKTVEQHRAEFEAFQEHGLERCNEGFYISINTMIAWSVWMEARGIRD